VGGACFDDRTNVAANTPGRPDDHFYHNDVAKYFAIIPVMFMVALPGLSGLNVMELATAQKCGVVSVDL
jgi:hypothetical protein